MKNRLRKLWKSTVPTKTGCPQPEAKEVLRRVRLAMNERPRPRARLAKQAVLLAAALLLLTVIALGAGSKLLPEGNVLDAFFGYGKNPAMAASLIETTLITVSDDHYMLTVTSSVADHSSVYFTLEVKPKTDSAREFMESNQELHTQFRFRVGIWGDTSGGGSFGSYDPETETLSASITKELLPIFSGTVRVRFEPMQEGLWLKLPVHPISAIRLRIDGEAQGTREHAAGGPVTLEQIKLSPLSVWMKYTTPTQNPGEPTLYFLWKDGHISTMGELHMSGPSGSAADDGGILKSKMTWKFGTIQDLTKMEAIIFGGRAYPLDGGTPYAYDTSILPEP